MLIQTFWSSPKFEEIDIFTCSINISRSLIQLQKIYLMRNFSNRWDLLFENWNKINTFQGLKLIKSCANKKKFFKCISCRKNKKYKVSWKRNFPKRINCILAMICLMGWIVLETWKIWSIIILSTLIALSIHKKVSLMSLAISRRLHARSPTWQLKHMLDSQWRWRSNFQIVWQNVESCPITLQMSFK